MQQLEFFPIPIDKKVDIEMRKMWDQMDKFRKSWFAKNAELKKELTETKFKLEYLEKMLCKQNQKEIQELF